MRTNHNTTRNTADRLYRASAVLGALLTPAFIVGLLLEVLL